MLWTEHTQYKGGSNETLKSTETTNTSLGKTFCCVRVDRGPPCSVSVMVEVTILSTTCVAVLQRACKVRCLDKGLSNWRGRCVDTWQELLRQYETKGDGFLEHISELRWKLGPLLLAYMKRASKGWHHSSSPKPREFRTQVSVRKVMLTLFWQHRCLEVQSSDTSHQMKTCGTP
jgi:hypothetical protein